MALSDASGEGPARRLSQREIDKLLGATAATGDGPSATPYNFMRPPRIPKDRRLSLEAVLGRASIALQGLFTTRLRMPTDVSATVEQSTFGEFLLSLTNPCAAFVFELGPKVGGQAALDLELELSFLMVDRIFGGPGEPLQLGRPLTMLERSAVRSFAQKIMVVIRDAWENQLQLDPEIVGFESTPDMLRIVNREDNVLVTRFDVRVGTFSGMMSFCLPWLALEGFLAEKGVKAMASVGPEDRAVVEQVVRRARLELAARFPAIRLSGRDVAALQVGQIIRTTQPIDAPVELHVNGRCRYQGVLGQHRGTLSLRITEPVDRRAGSARSKRGRIQ